MPDTLSFLRYPPDTCFLVTQQLSRHWCHGVKTGPKAAASCAQFYEKFQQSQSAPQTSYEQR